MICLPDAPIRAQVALEVDAGSARIWRASGAVEPVSLDRNRAPRLAVETEGGVLIAGDDARTGDLFFLHHRGGSTFELPTPFSPSDSLRTGPALLADADRMEGVAWLEGSGQDDFSIRAAAWNGTSWEDVETVSASTGRAQLALTSTVLSDGSWLVLWAGYDGSDDDIFWSRRSHGVWSPAQRVHSDNPLPDVLPTVVADGDTAHAAWSSFDGSDYRIRTARWTGQGWSSGGTLEGKGAVRAELERIDGRSFLTYRSVIPEAWNLVELDRAGVPRSTAFAEPFAERPLISAGTGPATLSWPWRKLSRGVPTR